MPQYPEVNSSERKLIKYLTADQIYEVRLAILHHKQRKQVLTAREFEAHIYKHSIFEKY